MVFLGCGGIISQLSSVKTKQFSYVDFYKKQKKKAFGSYGKESHLPSTDTLVRWFSYD